MLTANKWLQLLEQRGSRFGVDSEANVYQDEMGVAVSTHRSLERQKQLLQGHPPEMFGLLKEDERPKAVQDVFRYLNGEIGVTRTDRQKIRQNAAIWAVSKLLAILIIAVVTIRLVKLVFWQRIEKKTGQSIPSLISGMVAFIIYLLASFSIVAFVFGQPLTGLLATSGMFAMIIGLAVQMNISNIFSGVAVNMERPIRIGDWIQVSSYIGKVINMNWRTTQIQDGFGRLIVIPNHLFAESELINMSYPNEKIWHGFSVYVPPQYDPTKVEDVLQRAMLAAFPDITPWVMFAGVTVKAADYWVYGEIDFATQRHTFVNQVWLHIARLFKEEDIPFAIERHEAGLNWMATSTQSLLD